jgi:hypothetical protein
MFSILVTDVYFLKYVTFRPSAWASHCGCGATCVQASNELFIFVPFDLNGCLSIFMLFDDYYYYGMLHDIATMLSVRAAF